jgi:RimJ/RimL family protein N-acetyltransferase
VDVSIHEASGSELLRLRELVLAAIASDPTDPRLSSFRHELSAGPSPLERFVEYAVVVDGQLAARCQINFRPQPNDIDAYGPVAAELYATERVATLAGDLIAPAFRGLGLHRRTIHHRLTLLVNLGFTYAMCGVLVGNEVSRENYLRIGFTPIGGKEIDWGEAAVGDRIGSVVLFGLRLSDYAPSA